jgi:hypothetical protein
MRIPVKWSTHSAGSGPVKKEPDAGETMMTEVDRFRQEKAVSGNIISFPSFRLHHFVFV